jgi:hypothetical protein
MKSDASTLLSGFRGKIGKNFYQRIVNGTAFIQTCPSRRKISVGPDMPSTNKRFYFAAQWAHSILKNDEIRAQYQATSSGTNSPYTMAIKDYMTLPLISRVGSGKYRGQIRDRIDIMVDNVIRVKAVKVTIENADGSQLENDLASPGKHSFEWFYITKCTNSQLSGSTLRIEAWDLPNHHTEWVLVF